MLVAPAPTSEAITACDVAAMLYGATVALPATRLDHPRESQLVDRSIEYAATLSH
jgi:hypothetical protein